MLAVHECSQEGWSVLYVNEAGERGERVANEQDGEQAEEGWGEVRTAQQMHRMHEPGRHEFGRL